MTEQNAEIELKTDSNKPKAEHMAAINDYLKVATETQGNESARKSVLASPSKASVIRRKSLKFPELSNFNQEEMTNSPNSPPRRKSLAFPGATGELVLVQAEEEDTRTAWQKYSLIYLLLLIEIIFLILYSLFTNYDMDPTSSLEKLSIYPYFQDVHVMIFIGFGFLMTFLKNYSWSAVAKNFLIATWSIQLALLAIGFWKCVVTSEWKAITLDVAKIVDADFAAGAVLISFGAVLGKLTISQLLVMTTIEVIFYACSYNIVVHTLGAVDIGGSMTIHTFGAYFGLSVALMNKRDDVSMNPNNSSDYISNLFSSIGTLFLFMFWPSFNAALAVDVAKQRCIINTLLSICGSCVLIFLATFMFKKGKFHMENILNATLAGGVVVGSSADVITSPWIAFLFGIGGGFISLIGFEHIGPWLNEKITLQDTCGVNSLHGMTGLLGGLLTAFLVGFVTKDQYGDAAFAQIFPKIANGERSNTTQAGFNLAGLGVVIAMGIVGGVFTGLVIKHKNFDKKKTAFDDEEVWLFQAS